MSTSGGDHREYDLRGLLPRAERPLRGQRGLLRADRRRLATTPRASQRRRRRQRPLRLRTERDLPDRRVPDGELLGRRRLRHGLGGGGGGDTTPPTVSSTSPASGATGSGINANVTATFNEAMGAATLTHDDLPAHGTGRRAVVPATVSYDAATTTATLDPGAALANSTTYTATVRGGASGAKDSRRQRPRRRQDVELHDRGAPSSSGCPCSIWAPSATPEKPAETRTDAALEVGVKFRAETDGRIEGLRFYKGATQYGHPRRPPLEPHRHAARHRDVHQRDRNGLAAGDVRQSGGDHGEYDVRRLLPRAARQLRGQRGLLRRRAPSTTRRCGRSATAKTAATASTATDRAAPSRPASTGPRTTGSTSSSTPARLPITTAPRVTGELPPDGTQGVPAGTNVTAAFSEPMAASSITDLHRPAARSGRQSRPRLGLLRRRQPDGDPRPGRRPRRLHRLHREGPGRRRRRRGPRRQASSPPIARGRSPRQPRPARRPTRAPGVRSSSSARPRTRSRATTPRSCAPKA